MPAMTEATIRAVFREQIDGLLEGNEVPGITIPDEARAAMQAAGERGSEVGIEMADRLLATMESEVAGTYIMPSFGRYEQCAELVRRIRARHPAVAVAS